MSTSNPNAFVHELTRIRELIHSGESASAAQALNRLQIADPRDPRLYLLAIELADANGNPAGALAAARRAVELSPDWPVSVMQLAHVLSRLGQHREAMELAQRGTDLAPDELEVLVRAIYVAKAGDAPKLGEPWARRALEKAPRHVELRYELANFLRKSEQYREALDLYTGLLEQLPQSIGSRTGAAICAKALGDVELERKHVDQLVLDHPDSEEYRYARDVAYGLTPSTQPADTVANLFDNFASKFDSHLVRTLEYRAPELVAQRLLELYPDRKFNLLDLGCGTGLLAVYLGPIQGAMVGVDLSLEMLKQAARFGLYARLHHVNVLDALRETPDNQYEVIACNDVFTYVGDLTESVPNAHRILRPGGHFVFSGETAGEDETDLVLRPSNRYAHKVSAVRQLCIDAGFEDVEIQQLEQLRREHGVALPGFLVFARKKA